MKTIRLHSGIPLPGNDGRKGSILAITTSLLIVVLSMTALAVDLSYITLTRNQLQKSADAAARAAVLEMYGGWGRGAVLTPSQIDTAARQAAYDVATANEADGRKKVYVDKYLDIRLGQVNWNANTNTWQKSWGTAPFNLAEVTIHRDRSGSSAGDGPLNLYFAKMFGRDTANVHVVSACAMLPASGIRTVPNVNVPILPIALDTETWTNLMNGFGSDQFGYDPNTGAVSSTPDGVLEINLYPGSDPNLPSGNRGTVDLGSSNNSTADLTRQIRYGLNDEDLSYFGGQISFEDLPLRLNGDTGLSAGIKDDLTAIRGQPRLIPIYDNVSGNGNNAYYNVIKFVPVRVMFAQLTGKPSSKQVMIQPASFATPTVVAGNRVITQDTVFAPACQLR